MFRSLVARPVLSRQIGRLSSSTTTTTKPQYIHPLSQIVLTHLQSARGDWTRAQGLDTSLELQPDGTFQLTFPNQQGRLWTSYEDRKHWLSVQKGDLVGRFMLQDNTKPAWQDDSSKTSLPEKIVLAVDDMIAKIDGAQ